jgi:hypothetical protein
MTIDEIFEQWDKDSEIDRTELGSEALNISKLHNKYYKFYVNEKMKLIQMESDLKQISSIRHDFYSGAIDDDTLREMGWIEEFQEVGRKRILKTEVPRYLESDKLIIDKILRVAAQKEKVALLDSIIKSFVNRGFNIKAAVEWSKFQVGA